MKRLTIILPLAFVAAARPDVRPVAGAKTSWDCFALVAAAFLAGAFFAGWLIGPESGEQIRRGRRRNLPEYRRPVRPLDRFGSIVVIVVGFRNFIRVAL